MSFLRDFWTLLSIYRFRAHDSNGKEIFSVPLSWLFIVFLLCLFS
jgi:hypothetical protein